MCVGLCRDSWEDADSHPSSIGLQSHKPYYCESPRICTVGDPMGSVFCAKGMVDGLPPRSSAGRLVCIKHGESVSVRDYLGHFQPWSSCTPGGVGTYRSSARRDSTLLPISRFRSKSLLGGKMQVADRVSIKVTSKSPPSRTLTSAKYAPSTRASACCG
jgi:hypothetical protein